jgi:hypothetical protein
VHSSSTQYLPGLQSKAAKNDDDWKTDDERFVDTGGKTGNL